MFPESFENDPLGDALLEILNPDLKISIAINRSIWSLLLWLFFPKCSSYLNTALIRTTITGDIVFIPSSYSEFPLMILGAVIP